MQTRTKDKEQQAISITVKIDKALHSVLRQKSFDEDKSISLVIEEILRQGLMKDKNQLS